MSWVAVGVGVASIATSVISGSVEKKKAKKANAKAQAENDAQKAKESAALDKQVKAKQMAEMDFSRQQEGAANISAASTYANNQNEKDTASAIDRATRTGASTGEIMNMVSGLTAKGQNRSQQNAVQENNRKTQLMASSKGAAISAAESGLAGEQGQIALNDKMYNRTQQKQLMNNETARQNQEYWTSLVGDAGAGVMYSQMYGGGTSGGSKGTNAARYSRGEASASKPISISSYKFDQPTSVPKKVKY
jgi:hypothetical protein